MAGVQIHPISTAPRGADDGRSYASKACQGVSGRPDAACYQPKGDPVMGRGLSRRRAARGGRG